MRKWGLLNIDEAGFSQQVSNLVSDVNIHAERAGTTFLHEGVFVQFRQAMRVLGIDPFDLDQLDPASRFQCIILASENQWPGGCCKAPNQETLVNNIKVVGPLPCRREWLSDVMLAQIKLGPVLGKE